MEKIIFSRHINLGFNVVQKKISNDETICNYMDSEGNLLSNEWYSYCDKFYNGFAVVQRLSDRKYNYINPKGEYLSPIWFNACFPFYIKEGALIYCDGNGTANIIDANGQLVFKEPFYNIIGADDVWDMTGLHQSLITAVNKDLQRTIFNIKGEQLINEWYDDITIYPHGIICVERNEMHNFIDLNSENKEYLSDIWFNSVVCLHYDGLFIVGIKDSKNKYIYNILTEKGKLLSPNQWFNLVSSFDYQDEDKQEEYLAKVILNGKVNFMRKNGEFVNKVWIPIE